jgi:PIN domain nuclease of toxin-antitoxin system
MRALLDTHTFLWWIGNDAQLSERVRNVIAGSEAQILFSSINGWELAIKKLLGRFTPLTDIDTFVNSQVLANGFEILPFTLGHALRVAALPDHHKNPFDRALVAQAQVESIPILSADRMITRYPVEVIW